jgi:Fic family protein
MTHRIAPNNTLAELPPKIDLENPELLKATIKANRLLAELKGSCQRLPNIVTAQDELYQAAASIDSTSVPSSNKIKALELNGIAKRQTASTYLQKLAKTDVLRPMKVGKELLLINHRLMKIISESGDSK